MSLVDGDGERVDTADKAPIDPRAVELGASDVVAARPVDVRCVEREVARRFPVEGDEIFKDVLAVEIRAGDRFQVGGWVDPVDERLGARGEGEG